MTTRPGNEESPVARAVKRSSRSVSRRVEAMFSSKGVGFRRLAESHSASVAGDTLVALALAGTLFFSVPSSQARGNVFLYLLITLAPFALLGPFLGAVFERFPGAYKPGLVLASLIRVVVVAFMVASIDTLLLYPLAFLLLALSRLHGISRSSVLPMVLQKPGELIAANAQLARLGVLASVIVVPIGALATRFIGAWLGLALAGVAYLVSGWAASSVPSVSFPAPARQARPTDGRRRPTHREVRLARFATAGVRFLNGFLLLLVAFAFRDVDAGLLDFGALLAAAGGGFFVAAFISPLLEKRIPEEPMVVAALAVEAGAAFLVAQSFNLWLAAALAAAAGFAWGTAKFGFDGLLQATVPPEHRGRAFTVSETLFQIAWVIGSVLPVAITIPPEIGLNIAGVVALIIQLMYVSGVLLPIAEERRRRVRERDEPDTRPRVTELF